MNSAALLVAAAAAAPDSLCPNCEVGRLVAASANCPVCGYTERPAPEGDVGRGRLSAGLVFSYALWGLCLMALAVATVIRFRPR